MTMHHRHDHDEHPLCTCCPTPRAIMPWADDPSQWVHIDTQDEAEVRHVHHDSQSVDCDGTYLGNATMRIWTLNWEHIDPRKTAIGGDKPTFDDFWRVVAGLAMPQHAESASVRITGGERIEVHENTDEGGSSTEYRVCRDPWCAFDEAEMRDLTAEAAGY